MTGKIVWTDFDAERRYSMLRTQRDDLYREAQIKAEQSRDPRDIEKTKRNLLDQCEPINREMARLLGLHTVPGPMLIRSLQCEALGIKTRFCAPPHTNGSGK